MRHRIAIALFVTCLAGMALFVVGRLAGWLLVEEIGAWMTVPLWLVAGAISVIAALGCSLAALLRLAPRWRGRRPR